MKRMARLALMSGAETSVLLLNVVYNLMAIHPLTQILIQKEINRDNHGGKFNNMKFNSRFTTFKR